jgi:hypothetical protein
MKGKNYHVRLTEAEKNRLLDITKKGSRPTRQIIRVNILLQLDQSGKTTTLPEQETTAEHCGCQAALVSRVGKQYEQEGIGRVLNRKLRESPPAAPIVAGEAEAKITALCCGEPPEGCSRWTLRLLGSKAVELGMVEHISAPAVGNILKKTRINRI